MRAAKSPSKKATRRRPTRQTPLIHTPNRQGLFTYTMQVIRTIAALLLAATVSEVRLASHYPPTSPPTSPPVSPFNLLRLNSSFIQAFLVPAPSSARTLTSRAATVVVGQASEIPRGTLVGRLS